MSKQQGEIVLGHIRRLALDSATQSASDRQLLERFTADRDEAAFAALLDRYGAMVLRVCRRILHDAQEAEDAFQATFLILARKSGTIRQHQSLSSWLYKVAYRVAVRARDAAARRSELPARAPNQPAADPLAEVSGRELMKVLDEELQHLPEKYRMPLLLCYLEGHTQDEAARQLGWSPQVLRGRIERGRAVLRRRLIRRGFGLSAVLVGGLIEQTPVPAALPALLNARTLRAVRSSPLDPATVVSAQVAALVESGVHALAATKVKLMVSLVVVLGMLAAGAGFVGLQTLAEKTPPVQASTPSAPDKDAEKTPTAKQVDVQGDPLPPGALARLGTVRLRPGIPMNRLSLVFSADGKTLAAGSYQDYGGDWAGSLWSVSTGQLLHPLLGKGHWGYSLAFSPDGKILASAGRDQTIRLWDAATGKETRRFRSPAFLGILAYSPDGKWLAAMDSSEKVTSISLWDPATGKEVLRLRWHDGIASSLTFAPDGKTLASAGPGPKLSLWDIAAGKEVRRIDIGAVGGHWRPIAFTPDSKGLATRGADNALHLWNVANGEKVQTFRGHKKEPLSLAFSADGKILTSFAEDQTVRFWDVASGKERRTVSLDISSSWMSEAAVFSPDKKMLAVGSVNNAIRLWNLDTGKELLAAGHKAPIGPLAFSPDGKTVTSVSWDRTARRWDAATGRETGRFGGLKATLISIPLLLDPKDVSATSHLVYSSGLSSDGRLLATGESDKEARIHLWDATKGAEIRSFASKSGTVEALAFSPDGRIMASNNYDKTVRLWDAVTGKELHRLKGHEKGGYCVTFSPDGRWLASGGEDQTIRVWEVATGKERHHLRNESAVFAVAFSADGRTLAAGGGQFINDKPGYTGIVLWEMASGQERRRLDGPQRLIAALAFSPDGRYLASAGDGGAVRVWQPLTGKERVRFTGHRGIVNSLAFSHDGRRLVSGGSDTTALIWDTARIAEERQTQRQLSDRELEKATVDLLGQDAGKAYRALGTLVATPRQSLSWLKKQLKPVAGVEEGKIERLIEQLDDDAFAVREKASLELQKIADLAEPNLRKALKKSPSLESRRRLERILAPLVGTLPSVERLRQFRLLEVLEQIGTNEAKELLKTLAAGAPGVFLTREAKASLDRLSRRPSP